MVRRAVDRRADHSDRDEEPEDGSGLPGPRQGVRGPRTRHAADRRRAQAGGGAQAPGVEAEEPEMALRPLPIWVETYSHGMVVLGRILWPLIVRELERH